MAHRQTSTDKSSFLYRIAILGGGVKSLNIHLPCCPSLCACVPCSSYIASASPMVFGGHRWEPSACQVLHSLASRCKVALFFRRCAKFDFTKSRIGHKSCLPKVDDQDHQLHPKLDHDVIGSSTYHEKTSSHWSCVQSRGWTESKLLFLHHHPFRQLSANASFCCVAPSRASILCWRRHTRLDRLTQQYALSGSDAPAIIHSIIPCIQD